MRWLVFVIFTIFCLSLEAGLSTLLAVGTVTPSFVLVLAIFVALWAPPMPAASACLILGLTVDLLHPVSTGGSPGAVALLGPAALAFLGGGYLALQVRSMVFRDSPVALAMVVLLLGVFVQVVLVAVLTARGFAFLTAEPIPNWSATSELLRRLGSVLYSALVALPLGFFLIRTAPLWGFTPPPGRS